MKTVKSQFSKLLRFLLLILLVFGFATPVSAGGPQFATGAVPGSMIVFPKFTRGTVIVDGVEAPATEIAVRVVCPMNTTCAEGQQMRVRAEWVCPGSATNPVCAGRAFEFDVVINGTVAFDPENIALPGSDPLPVLVPPCQRGYLIAYAIDGDGRPIKWPGLGGVAVLRESGSAITGYTASLIAADPNLAIGALISLGPDDALVFDGAPGHYTQLNSMVEAPIEFTRSTSLAPLGGFPSTSIILLTLDVRSNGPNGPTTVPLNFFDGDGQRRSTSTNFVCWSEQRLDDIDANLTFEAMGTRWGYLSSGQAQQVSSSGTVDITVPATLLGLAETIEGPVPGAAARAGVYALSPIPPLVSTTFVP